MTEGKWYRVTDPLNPLYGCDVRVAKGFASYLPDDFDVFSYLLVLAMRRMDLFVGDRPFQLVAKKGEDLGLLISEKCLEESPIQDDIVETATDRPYGRCLDESEMTRGDGVTLRIARYENATQIAVEGSDTQLMGTATDVSDRGIREEWERAIVAMFDEGADAEDIAYALEEN